MRHHDSTTLSWAASMLQVHADKISDKNKKKTDQRHVLCSQLFDKIPNGLWSKSSHRIYGLPQNVDEPFENVEDVQ